MKIEGIVRDIKSTKWNGKTLYSMAIEGQDPLYGLGEHEPNFGVGSNVVFEATQKGKYWNVDFKTLEVKASAPTPTASTDKGGGWADKDDRITFMSARNAAIELLGILVSSDSIVLPKTPKARYEALLGYCDNLTVKMYEDVGNRHSMVEAMALGASSVEVDGDE